MISNQTKKFFGYKNEIHRESLFHKSIIYFVGRKKHLLGQLGRTRLTNLASLNIENNINQIRNFICGDKIECHLDDISYNMIYCESSDFLMGSSIERCNNPQKLERIDQAFLLAETEVTQEFYEKVMECNTSHWNIRSFKRSGIDKKETKKLPIETLTWLEAVEFCNKLSELSNLDLCYDFRNCIIVIFKGDELLDQKESDSKNEFYDLVIETIESKQIDIYYNDEIDDDVLYSADIWLYYEHPLHKQKTNSKSHMQKKIKSDTKITMYNLYVEKLKRDKNNMDCLYSKYPISDIEQALDPFRNGYWTYNTMKNGYRLPMSKEWEYAALAGTNNKWSGCNDNASLKEYAWLWDFAHDVKHNVSTPQEVATKKPNEWGFYDMVGNVWEWCNDKKVFYETESHRCLRGGSFVSMLVDIDEDERYSDEIRHISKQLFVKETDYESSIGFRIARTIG